MWCTTTRRRTRCTSPSTRSFITGSRTDASATRPPTGRTLSIWTIPAPRSGTRRYSICAIGRASWTASGATLPRSCRWSSGKRRARPWKRCIRGASGLPNRCIGVSLSSTGSRASPRRPITSFTKRLTWNMSTTSARRSISTSPGSSRSARGWTCSASRRPSIRKTM